MPPNAQAAFANMHALSLQAFLGGIAGEAGPVAPKQGSQRMPLGRLNAGDVGRDNQPDLMCDVCGGGPFKNVQIHQQKNSLCKKKRGAEAAAGGPAHADGEDGDVCKDPTHKSRHSRRTRCSCASCVTHWEKVDTGEDTESDPGCRCCQFVRCCCCMPNSSQLMDRNPQLSDVGRSHLDAKPVAWGCLAAAAWETRTERRGAIRTSSRLLPEVQCKVP